jgi:hypothetical protein
MTQGTELGMVALGCALLFGNAALADAIVTDANIVTGLDISYSIGPDDLQLQIEGMAQAMRSPEVLAAIRSGRYGRIGFAVFAWHHNQFPEVVPWVIITSQADALAVARTIEARLDVNVEMEARRKEAYYIGRLTDLSQAIDHAAAMISTAPYASDRAVVNIVGNGDDNVGEEAGVARDRITEIGATVNGVVLGGDPLVLDYYREQVVGGPGAFVISTGDAGTLVEVMTRKFLYDIIVAEGSAER